MPATATPLPTPEQMKAYVETLPDIYREIIRAIHRAQPERRYGHAVSPYAVLSELAESRLPFNKREFLVAIRQLNDTGFLSGYDLEDSWEVTEVGEELIAEVTGKKAKRVEVPPLPKPNW